MVNKKIGLLNFQYSTHNYGAVLQAAALEYLLREEGHNVEHIDYIPGGNVHWRNIVKRLLTKFKLYKHVNHSKPANSEVFELFRKKFLNRSATIQTEQQFVALSSKYDLVVVGSDQVWRPSMASNPEAFFLKYVPDEVDRVAYAASFGAVDWELDEVDPLTKLARVEVRKFKAVSCRETSGVEICKTHFGVAAEHVLDPLLLAPDQFIKKIIASANPSKSKLVYYKLDHDEAFLAAMSALEHKHGYKAHNIYARNGTLNEYENVEQWLRNVYDSKIVVSDSFHCICLGLRFGKEVIYSPNPRRGEARMNDLFSYLGVKKSALNISVGESSLYALSKSQDFQENYDFLIQKSKSFIQSIA